MNELTMQQRFLLRSMATFTLEVSSTIRGYCLMDRDNYLVQRFPLPLVAKLINRGFISDDLIITDAGLHAVGLITTAHTGAQHNERDTQ